MSVDALVDRFQAAVERVESAHDERNVDSTDVEESAAELAAARKAILDFISDGIKWVSVEERVPANDDSVIVCTHSGWRGEGWWDGKQWFDYSTGATFWSLAENITHWMPLPEAPK